MKGIALTPIWNHEKQQTINIGEIFDLSNDAIASLVRVGAAISIEGETMFTTGVEYRDASETPVTIGATAVFLPDAVKDKRRAFIQAQGGAIRYRFVGPPTAASGFVLNDGDSLFLESELEVEQFRAIAVSGTVTLWATGFS